MGICSIFTYELPAAEQAERESGYPLHSLTTYSALLETARESGLISNSEQELLRAWREDPAAWTGSSLK